MSDAEASARGLIARAGRSAESGYEMTRAARHARYEKIRNDLLSKNPDLTDAELDKAIKLVVRAQMARLSELRWPKP